MACHTNDIPADGGACALINGRQIAIFHFARRGEWYATDNQCPHRQQMALSRGMTGSHQGEPKVAQDRSMPHRRRIPDPDLPRPG